MSSRLAAPKPVPVPVPVPNPVSATLFPPAPAGGDGRAQRTAIVLAPVMARWDGGAFFTRVTEPLLSSGHRVTVYDTLSLLRDGDDLAALTARWARVLVADGPVDLLVGNALGGAVVQALLAHEWTHRARVLLLSGPTVADEELNAKLERIASAVASHGLTTALGLLEAVVRRPEPKASEPKSAVADAADQEPADQEPAGHRLATGLRLLRDVDARRAVQDFPGRLLHLYGTESRLVRRHHLVAGPRHQCVGIPRSGMRPHADRPDLTGRAIARFLKEDDS
ncbi:hypothetical protein OK074_4668 [Actinobacteria bacterium OK074]|nr:hypothetical protein OK074_4668 [Actinobacteria bacterium OK074]